jgi:tetratricopeptide (TPR) repeat protein
MLMLAVPGDDGASACTRNNEGLNNIWNPVISEAWARKIEAEDSAALPTANYLRRALATYATAWSDAATESCGRTYGAKTQSEELFDLTMQCLATRRSALRTLVTQLSTTEDLLSINPVLAVHGLPEIDDCKDATTLRQRSGRELTPTQLERYHEIMQGVASAEVLVDVGKSEEALLILQPFMAELEHDTAPSLRAPVALAQGIVLESLGRYQEANTALEQASIYAELAGDRILTARARVALTTLTGDRLANESVGMLWSRLAAAAIDAANLQGGSIEARLHSNIGLVLEKAERHSEAFERFRHALSIAAQADSPEPVRSILHNNFANSLATHGEYDEALSQAQLAQDLAAGSLGEDSVAALAAIATTALVWDLQGDYERSLAILKDPIAALEAKHKAYAPLAVSLRGNRAVLLAKLGRLREAETEFRFVLEARTRTFGRNHPDVATALTNLAACLRMDGRVNDSVPYQQRAIEVLGESPSTNAGRLALALSGLANSLERLGRVDEALPLRLRVLELHETSQRGVDANFIVDLSNAVHTMALVSDPRAMEFSDQAMAYLRDHDIDDAARSYVEITRARAMLGSPNGRLPSTRQEARALVSAACERLPSTGSEAERRVAAEIFAAQRWPLPKTCDVQDVDSASG